MRHHPYPGLGAELTHTCEEGPLCAWWHCSYGYGDPPPDLMCAHLSCARIAYGGCVACMAEEAAAELIGGAAAAAAQQAMTGRPGCPFDGSDVKPLTGDRWRCAAGHDWIRH